MFHKEWEVLLVDDEPDVLSVTKLAMKDIEVYGVPLRLITAESKAEALEYLKKAPKNFAPVAVAFIDVVMETDTAGLGLCQFIREDMNNPHTQLYIRTGQPGISTEREVIDKYEISGYFTKEEATEDKLYSLVKSGIRQYLSSWYLIVNLKSFQAYVNARESREKLAEAVQMSLTGAVVDEGDTVPRDSMAVVGALIVDGQKIAGMGLGDEAALEMRNKLDKLEGTKLTPEGNKYVRDENNNLMIKIAGTPSRAEVIWVARTAYSSPLPAIIASQPPMECLATLWHTAG